MSGYRKPPGHRVYHTAPLATYLRARYPSAPIKGPRGLAALTGTSERAMRRLLAGHTRLVRETTADRILTALGHRLGDVYDLEPAYQHQEQTA